MFHDLHAGATFSLGSVAAGLPSPWGTACPLHPEASPRERHLALNFDLAPAPLERTKLHSHSLLALVGPFCLLFLRAPSPHSLHQQPFGIIPPPSTVRDPPPTPVRAFPRQQPLGIPPPTTVRDSPTNNRKGLPPEVSINILRVYEASPTSDGGSDPRGRREVTHAWVTLRCVTTYGVGNFMLRDIIL